MKPIQILLATAALTLAAALFAGPAAAAWPHTQTIGPTQHVALTIAPGGTSMAAEHVARGNFAIQPGVPVQVTITNLTHRFHSFTIRALGVSALVGPAHGSVPATKTFTFVTHTYGAFDWRCVFCPDAHHEATTMQMGGMVYSIIGV